MNLQVTEMFFKDNHFNLMIIYCIQDCINENGIYTKDLTLVDRDLSNVVILDNSPKAYKYFPGF